MTSCWLFLQTHRLAEAWWKTSPEENLPWFLSLAKGSTGPCRELTADHLQSCWSFAALWWRAEKLALQSEKAGPESRLSSKQTNQQAKWSNEFILMINKAHYIIKEMNLLIRNKPIIKQHVQTTFSMWVHHLNPRNWPMPLNAPACCFNVHLINPVSLQSKESDRGVKSTL